MHAIARRLPQTLAAVGLTRNHVLEQFHGALPHFLRRTAPPQTALLPPKITSSPPLRTQVHASIEALDPREWDATAGQHADLDSASMRAAEALFHRNHPQPEYRWNFHYVLVRDLGGELQAAVPLLACQIKDDAFIDAAGSAAGEGERPPSLLTSKALLAAGMVAEGQQVYLKAGPQKDAALMRLVDEALLLMRSEEATLLVLGAFREDQHFPRLSSLLASRGLFPLRLPDSHLLSLDWRGEEAFLSSLSSPRRKRLVRKVHEQSPLFRWEVWPSAQHADGEMRSHLHALYLNLLRKDPRRNLLPLPCELLAAHLASGAWELLLLWLRDPQRPRPVAWAACRYVGDELHGLYSGVDEQGFDRHEMSPYRQLLWQLCRRAGHKGCRRVSIGMGVDYEKQLFGTVPRHSYAFARSDRVGK
jgi:hypothetical protein